MKNLAAKERKERREILKLKFMVSGFSFEFFAFFCGQPEAVAIQVSVFSWSSRNTH